jgi:predicted signal transduction protein with EAL and GGDEF domain
MSISIGAVVTAVAGADAESLLDAADTGLYRAKADGKGRWVLHILDTDTSRGSQHRLRTAGTIRWGGPRAGRSGL